MREPAICGGTSRRVDKDAPKSIKSDKMVFLKAESALQLLLDDNDRYGENEIIDYISAFAVKLTGGSFLLLEKCIRYENTKIAWAFVKEDIFPELVKAVNESQLARENGLHSYTSGLPRNFGGEVRIDYESGEKISFSNNQTPLFSRNFAVKLNDIFTRAMKTEKASVPDAENIVSVNFHEQSSFGYTDAKLKKNDDGNYTLTKIYKFEEPEIHKYTDMVSDSIIEKIRTIVNDNAVLIWNEFPKTEYNSTINKSLTFVFSDGKEVTVCDDRRLPLQLSSAFFKIESEL